MVTQHDGSIGVRRPRARRLLRKGIASVCVAALAACGGGETDDTPATQTGASDRGTARAQAFDEASMVRVPDAVDPLFQGLAIPADAPTRGLWSGVQAWPLNALHAALLPDGRVLTYGTTLDGTVQNGRYLDVWNPAAGFVAASHDTRFRAEQQDSFCSAATYLQDGRLMISGGNGAVTSTLFDPASNTVTTSASPMADERWYATMLTLPDGRPLMLGGMVPYAEGMQDNPDQAVAQGLASMTPEVYDGGVWRSLFGASSREAFGPDFLRASYPRAWVAPSGRVFGISAERMWSLDATGGGALTLHGAFKAAPNTTTRPNVGATNTAVMFDIGKVLVVGGNGSFNGDGLPASKQATVVDINGNAPVLTEQAAMATERRFPNAVVLPDGSVAVTGGTRRGNNNGADAVFASELWSPATGTWRTGASAAIFRGYHSFSLLLPNGTVLSTGGGAPGPVTNLNAEVYYPPQLFRSVNGVAQLAPRPVLRALNGYAHASLGELNIELASATTVSQVVLLGVGNGTHSFNAGQRRVPIAFTQAGARLVAPLPDRRLAPPGYYQLVVIDAAGVPSRGVVISLGMNAGTPSAGLLEPGRTVALAPASQAGSLLGALAEGAGLSVLQAAPVGSLPPPTAQFVVRPGLADATCVSFASVTAPDAWLRHAGFRLQRNVNDGSALFGQDATFCAEPAASGGGLALRSKNFPTHLLRHRNGELWLDPQAGDDAFVASARFTVLSAGLQRGAPMALEPIAARGQAVAVSAEALGVLAPVPAGTVPGAAAQFVVRDGLADAACVSLESVAVPGRWLRHANYRVLGAAVDGSELFRQDATFCAEPGLAGQGVTLRSKNFPTHVLRHRGAELWIDPVQADAAFAASASFAAWPTAARANAPSPDVPALPAAPLPSGGTASYAPGLDGPGLSFSWNFGDGSAPTAFSPTSVATHVYAAPGLYTVSLTVRSADGQTTTKTFTQAVHGPATATAPRASSSMAIEPRAQGAARLWVVNPDQDTVTVLDSAGPTRVAEVAVGKSPRHVALAGDGRLWVSNKDAATISIVDPASLAVVQTVNLPRASRPHGLAFQPGGDALVVLEASGQLLRLDPVAGTVRASIAVGAHPRHVSVSGDGRTALVSRFITPPLPGESTAAVDTSQAGAEVLAVDLTTSRVAKTIVLRHSDKTDTEIQGSGIPNYLAAAVIAPDGASAWVPSKQDNVKRGSLRNGQPLDFQNTVRAITSRIDLTALAELPAQRIDHDNASLASAAAFHPSGAYLFVALETSREVAVVNALGGGELMRLPVGRAPRGLAVAPDGQRLFVQNELDRSVSVVDLGPLVRNGELRTGGTTQVATVAKEALAAQVLLGKQLFHDARDPRLARDGYMSCASCHNEGGQDGRVWDLTQFGEGLRNTVALQGRAGLGHGFLHWSANFDEVQDFEKQIRELAGGTGLMTAAQYGQGTRAQPLGDPKTGVSADLDALAAYVSSLDRFAPSPLRPANGGLTAAAAAGQQVFQRQNCASCHGGTAFSSSGTGSALKNIGTVATPSGRRLGTTLTGLDVPTLRDVWATAPYLHDGRAPTLAAAVQAHAGQGLGTGDLDNLVAYLQQIGSDEVGTHASLLSQGRSATQSSTDYGGSADRAVDGKLGGDFAAGSVTHTRMQAQPWWQVDLGQLATVSQVTLWIRTDCCVQRLQNAMVFIAAADMSGRTLAQLSADPTVTARAVSTLGGAASLPLPFAPTSGRYVRVQLVGTEFLSLAEVQVFGSPSATPSNRAPTVAMTAPSNGTSVASGAAVNLAATASDADGTIAKVEFYDGATLIGTDTSAPYAFVWRSAGVGTHDVVARATDNAGATATSSAVRLTVAPPPRSNLAATASLATSYVSPWESLPAIRNGITPQRSSDKNGGAYGNWQGTAVYGRTDWVSFTWPTAKTLSSVEVYWWNDGQGIATPTAAQVQAWNGQAWVAVGALGVGLHGFNALSFAPVTTTALRVSMRSARATGILEARVWGY